MIEIYQQHAKARRKRAEQLAEHDPQWAQSFRDHLKPVKHARGYGASKQTSMRVTVRTEEQYESGQRWQTLFDADRDRKAAKKDRDPVEAVLTLSIPFAEALAVGFLMGAAWAAWVTV